MKTAIPKAIGACVIGLALAGGAQAQDQPPPAEAKAFAEQYVAASNANDKARVLSLFHPKSVACITPETKDFYDGAMEVSMREAIPADYKFTVMPVNQENLKAIESIGRFPVTPRSEMHIDYQQGDDSGSVVLWLARENGRWFADQPCASEQTLKQFRDGAAARKEAEARYKAFADGIKDPLRTELIAMLHKHETGSATDRYHEASGQDMKTSMFVINELKAEAK